MRFPARAFAALAILAITARVGVYAAFQSTFAFEQTGIVQGFVDYDLIAKNIINSGEFTVRLGLPYASVAPAFPLTLAGVYALFGRGSFQVVLLNSAFVVAAIALLLSIAIGVMPKGRPIGILAALFLAVYPYMVFQDLTLIDTSMFMAVLLGFLLCMIVLERQTGWSRKAWLLIATSGVVLGILILTRPLGFGLGIAAFLWFWMRLGLRNAILRLVPVAFIGLLVIIPWNVRNYRVFGTFVNVGTHAGMNFWFGNSEFTIPFYKAGYHTQWATPQIPSTLVTAPEIDRHLMNLGLTYIREHPEQIPELFWVKLIAYWNVNVFPTKNPVAGEIPNDVYTGMPTSTIDPNGTITVTGVPTTDPLVAYSESFFDRIGRIVHMAYFGGLFALAIIGFVQTFKNWRDVSLIVFVQLVMTLLYITLSGPTTRYRVPTDPLLFLFSAVALYPLWLHFSSFMSTRFVGKNVVGLGEP